MRTWAYSELSPVPVVVPLSGDSILSISTQKIPYNAANRALKIYNIFGNLTGDGPVKRFLQIDAASLVYVPIDNKMADIGLYAPLASLGSVGQFLPSPVGFNINDDGEPLLQINPTSPIPAIVSTGFAGGAAAGFYFLFGANVHNSDGAAAHNIVFGDVGALYSLE